MLNFVVFRFCVIVSLFLFVGFCFRPVLQYVFRFFVVLYSFSTLSFLRLLSFFVVFWLFYLFWIWKNNVEITLFFLSEVLNLIGKKLKTNLRATFLLYFRVYRFFPVLGTISVGVPVRMSVLDHSHTCLTLSMTI